MDLRVRVGADGRIRGFSVLSVKERDDNPFVGSPVRRLLAKAELFVRGYSFGEGEVMARLVDAVWEGVEDTAACFVQLAGDLEVYLGALGLRDRQGGREDPAPDVALGQFVTVMCVKRIDGHSSRQRCTRRTGGTCAWSSRW